MGRDRLEHAIDLWEDNFMSGRRSSLTRALADVLSAMEAIGARPALVGALACGSYVEPRTTRDVDFLVGSLEEASAIVASASRTFETAEPPDVVTRMMHKATGVAVDLLVAEARFEHEGLRAARPRLVRGLEVRVLPPDHLAAMKVHAASDPRRDYDFGDARRLILDGAARASRVAALVRRDLPRCAATLAALLEAVEAARRAPAPPRRGTRRRG